ncbi:MAG: c-type cytochrome [Nitrosomonadales bacterium]|nr:c-type cytochrome [Nitrosomonadales bacterium]
MKKNFTAHILLACGALLGMSLSAVASAADAPKAAESCIACHGKDGNSTDTHVPNIASYSEEYLANTMKKYQNKERPCVEAEYQSGSKKGTKSDMCKIAAELSADDIAKVGEYFTAQTFVRTAQTTDPELVKKGKSLYKLKCYTCHSEDGSFPGDHAGILAGQKMAYVKQQTKFFKEGKRPMPKKMKPKMENLDDAEIEALVHYFGSIQ